MRGGGWVEKLRAGISLKNFKTPFKLLQTPAAIPLSHII